jgi:hypothetical protein|nr:MAG TPA: hypothetical protein [Caudoviricetes sp.]
MNKGILPSIKLKNNINEKKAKAEINIMSIID